VLTMLVVDDELYALKGITQGIDWSDLPIGAVLEAESVDQAKRLMRTQQVDLVISDIDMPGASGLELLRYINETSPVTLTMFLTGHARFEYAQEAVQHGCFAYVLKPVDHDELKKIVRRAADEVGQRRLRQDFEATIEDYRRQWTSQLPILVERFWQDALDGAAPVSPERLDRALAQYDIPLTAADRVLPVLLSIEEWNVALDDRDERIMEYAVRKAAAEIVLGELPGAVVQTQGEMSIVLLYMRRGESCDRAALKQRCGQYVQACGDYFHCRVSCYVGDAAGIGELAGSLERLSELERANVNRTQSVLDIDEQEEPAAGASGLLQISYAEWGILLDGGRIDELADAIAQALERLQEEPTSRETLEMFYYGFIHMLYQAVQRKGIALHEAIAAAELQDGLTARSPQTMAAWAVQAMRKIAEACLGKQRESSAVIAKIQAYIQGHLHQELSRDDIARCVYRNPAYLSRLFRKETGLSLSDYIVQVKIERAKRLLAETNDKISHIAESLGYVHFSYFAKLFRKMTGVTPQDYRKQHQQLHG